MDKYLFGGDVLKTQQIILIAVVAILLISIITGYFSNRLGGILNHISIIMLIIAAPLRLISVAEYFRRSRDKKFQYLSYTAIAVIVIAGVIKMVI